MEMQQLFSNSVYKILEVSLAKGEKMPRHKASSDAFIMVKQGSGKITFDHNSVLLQQGATQHIPAHEPHQLEISENFTACIVMEAGAAIDFL